MKEPLEYRETFVRTTSNPQYVIDAVKDSHPEEKGWTIGEPIIEKLENGEYKVSISLSKRNDELIERKGLY